ncbi:DUF3298 and DUF4163 domain-containing protein [Faecalicatena contorta]|uniref:DUF3298/DUF4163 domain-containing protein n=1 Tax=Faecalicatena contorta TaxID=39482 RepID=A0A315ZWM1_9FIRM|nr:DUF3298 and DUF4163 domain-containing protein [Faecalicatena contorta]PWJ49653.1 uncharacterized protein DUF3298 [Faecalicatena contorta]SUQ14371.1 Protein of unknown function [Faecalicatena contorta]
MQNISQKVLEDTMYTSDIPVFSYKINYPYFTTQCSQAAAQNINQYYADYALKTERHCRTILYPQAVETAKYIVNNKPPFNTYTFQSVYEVTYNQNCTTSLYFDNYTFMGGAHGATFRNSDTWNFFSGSRMTLEDFYPQGASFTDSLFTNIEQQIEERLKTEPGSYFDNYEELLRKNFHPENYFLKPEGIVIYYQQYDIAPYYTGIPEFLIPFSPSG